MKIWDNIVKTSVMLQFGASKASLIISGTTLATVLSLRFELPWHLAIIAVAILSISISIAIYFSGWIHREAKYGQELSNLHPRLDEVMERLDRIEKKVEG